ncbi:hypothetical protein LEP1GSC202_2867 [Leptospira yanagawae serovar Saopaulo str. Sao Paulo = ATCC 700523]|uniref:Lipoprotein n=1 Tax=Leptospira yanagawae serovar Saopaulo str. Sao Paulo = ATCC 700523 TaxID=1249483 RepID=A0A5E8HBV1_9LEPT|nr:hypothetical protein [Leptospira yanagawae]EOQ87496.1 hypothetical protein LEP1GSC202_2867 [Leptospira yanagawae serovar Saopaulo str. Sao Paulo = ATCC 700523]
MFSISLQCLSFLFVLLFSFSCKSTTERLFDPRDSKDEQVKTLVGFLLFDETERTDILIASSFISLQSLNGDNIDIYEIQEMDEAKSIFKGGSTKLGFYYFEEEEKTYVSYSYSSKNSMYNPNVLDGNKEYLIRELKWTRGCGERCTISMNSRLNPFKSYNTLKIKGKPGEIVFLGIYTIKTKAVPGSTSLFSNKGNFTIEFNQILDDSEFYHRKIDPDREKEIFDLKYGKNQKSAEIKFLRSIIEMQKEGFWHTKAKEKLKLIEN